MPTDNTIKIDTKLDARGMNCPLPVLKTKKTVDGMETGQILKIISSDPGSRADIPSFCKQSGHELLEIVEEGQDIIFTIRKN